MNFRRAVWASALAHGAVAFFFMTKAFFAPSVRLDLQDAIRVDIVGLPQKILPDEAPPPEPAPTPKPAAPAPEPEPAPPVPPKPTPPPPPAKTETPKLVEKPKPVDVTKSQKSALNRLKEMNAFAKLEKAVAEKREAAPAPKPIAGHKVTSGASLTGIERLDYDRYGAALKARVIENWHVPAWLAETELIARVRVWLDGDGHVSKKQIVHSSGNDVFDQAALDAVSNSDPFPPPPDNLRGVLAGEGFTLGLPK